MSQRKYKSTCKRCNKIISNLWDNASGKNLQVIKLISSGIKRKLSSSEKKNPLVYLP